MRKIKSIFWLGMIMMLLATRWINLGWGLPYPFHPDERNMAVAIMNLNWQDYFNPHFFAYGQLPLYLGYLLIIFKKIITGGGLTTISFTEAVWVLRIISVVISILTVFVCIKIINQLMGSKVNKLTGYLLFVFSPVLIQLDHFGTTESLLMFFFTLIVYFCIQKLQKKIDQQRFLFFQALFIGLAIATKVSSMIFIVLPVIILIQEKNFLKLFFQLILFAGNTLVVAIIFSPYNFIDFKNFLTSFNYESAVALGKLPVFYTQQFFGSLPIIFQIVNIFPYALGWPVFVLFFTGFTFLPWKKELLFLRLAFLIYFLPTAFLYTKWTRFMAPLYPLAIIFAVLFLNKIVLKVNRLTCFTLCILCCLPGVFYLNIYFQKDVRIQATEWMNKNITEQSVILQESGNVIDLPLTSTKNFKNVVFDFYNLDNDKKLQQELEVIIQHADYIIIPSRRVYKNYTCQNPKSQIPNPKQIPISKIQLDYSVERCNLLVRNYPLLNKYYRQLFSGKLGFLQVAEFSTAIFSDEQAEETWSVFDHPVVRVYRRQEAGSKM